MLRNGGTIPGPDADHLEQRIPRSIAGAAQILVQNLPYDRSHGFSLSARLRAEHFILSVIKVDLSSVHASSTRYEISYIVMYRCQALACEGKSAVWAPEGRARHQTITRILRLRRGCPVGDQTCPPEQVSIVPGKANASV